MARYTGPVDKLSRRECAKLFLKAERDFTDKSGFDRRPYPPGQHGLRRIRLSEYGLQLREKQKLKRSYGLLERQFRKCVAEAQRQGEATGLALLKALELRLDNVVHRLGFGGSIALARQLVTHGHIAVNGHKCTIPSRILKRGDEVSVRDRSKEILPIRRSLELKNREVPGWLELNREALSGKVISVPDRTQMSKDIDENLVVEFYSR